MRAGTCSGRGQRLPRSSGPGRYGCANRREVPALTAAFVGERCCVCRRSPGKAAVTAATLGVSLGDKVPAEACRASREGAGAFGLLPAASPRRWKQLPGEIVHTKIPPPPLSLGFSVPSVLLKLLLMVDLILRLSP